MILGLLSDTHGNAPRTRTALGLLRAAGAGHLVHCGDVGSEEVLLLLLEEKERGTPLDVAAGNVDEWNPDLVILAKHLGLPLRKSVRMQVDGLQIAVCHGHDAREMDALLADPRLDVLFTGHTHQPRDEKRGHARVVNPGAVHRAKVPGVATFDTSTGRVEWIPLNPAT